MFCGYRVFSISSHTLNIKKSTFCSINLKNFAYSVFILVFYDIFSDLNFCKPQVQWKKCFLNCAVKQYLR